MGVPTVLVASEPFLPLARAVARQKGFENLAIVTIPHPVGGVEPHELDAVLLAATAEIERRLTTAPEAVGTPVVESVVDAPTDAWDFFDFAMQRGWSDGLPLFPPTPDLVAGLVAASGVTPGKSLGAVPPSDRHATIEAIAANAAMAGLMPQLMPVVVAAVRAVLAPQFNLQALTTTTHPVTPLVVVHGSIVEELGFNAGPNVFGQGNRANATVGRALRLVLQNVGGAVPGQTDRATHGQPGKYAYCIAENASDSPFPAFHVDRVGDVRGAVTVFGGEGPHNVNDHGSTDAQGVLRNIAGTLATLGCNNLYMRGEMMVVLGPEHADLCGRAGMDRHAVGAALKEMARIDVRNVSAGNMDRFVSIAPRIFTDLPEDGTVPVLGSAESALILVAGGPGKHTMVIPSFGATVATTVPVEMPSRDA